ncbi:MAG: glycoside hydrolase family 18 protein [Pantoea sp.]|nr:glycoside hydrolase family 18 protein [Pantoea sp.]
MRLNKIAKGLLLASCTVMASYNALAVNDDLLVDDQKNVIVGLNEGHMYSTDDGKTWHEVFPGGKSEDNKEITFFGEVSVTVAEYNYDFIEYAYDETKVYDTKNQYIIHDGWLWQNQWWAGPGQLPGVDPVWLKLKPAKPDIIKVLRFSPYTGQQALDYQKELKEKSAGKRKVIGYFPEWGVYEAHDYFTPDKVAYDQISHLNYGFAVVTPAGVIETHDTWKAPALMKDIAKRTKKAGVINMLSVGGYNNSQLCAERCNEPVANQVNVFEAATATAYRVERLSQSIVDYMMEWGFDGVDIDWEYPATEKQAAQYTQLLKSLRAKLDALGLKNDRYFQLSSAVTANHNNIIYTNPAVTAPLLDSVNVMSYDYHGAFDEITGHNSPLYANSLDSDKKFNIDSTMKEYHQTWGIPKSKLMVGLSWYGRAWDSVTGSEKVAGLPGLFNEGRAGVKGQWDDQNEFTGTNPYRKLKQMALSNKFKRYWDAQAQVPYLYNVRTKEFHTYDDAASIKGKVDYIESEGYGGAIIWDLSGDTEDHELGAISAKLLSQETGLNLKYEVARQPNGRVAIKTTLDKETFNAEKRIVIYINDTYEGEIYNGKSYYSYNTYYDDGGVTVKTNFTAEPKVGDEVRVVLATGKPNASHIVESSRLLKSIFITEDMLK